MADKEKTQSTMSYRLAVRQSFGGDKAWEQTLAEWPGDSPTREDVRKAGIPAVQKLQSREIRPPHGISGKNPPRFRLYQEDPKGNEHLLASYLYEDAVQWDRKPIPRRNTRSILYLRRRDEDAGRKLKEFEFLEDTRFTPQDYLRVVRREAEQAGLELQPDDVLGVYRFTVDPDFERVDDAGMSREKQSGKLRYDPSGFPEDMRFGVRVKALEPDIRSDFLLVHSHPEPEKEPEISVLKQYPGEPDDLTVREDQRKAVWKGYRNPEDQISLMELRYDHAAMRLNGSGELVPRKDRCLWNDEVSANARNHPDPENRAAPRDVRTVQEIQDDWEQERNSPKLRAERWERENREAANLTWGIPGAKRGKVRQVKYQTLDEILDEEAYPPSELHDVDFEADLKRGWETHERKQSGRGPDHDRDPEHLHPNHPGRD